jgi:hypothetical protein
MSYASMAALADDAAFRDRVLTCAKEQALIYKDDGRADIKALADQVIINEANASGLFELVCVAPNFRDVTDPSTTTDGDILAAVQANWPTYAAVLYAPPSVP